MSANIVDIYPQAAPEAPAQAPQTPVTPSQPPQSTPATPCGIETSRWRLWRNNANDRIRTFLGRCMQRMGVPGFVADQRIEDPMTGLSIDIRVTPYGTTIDINGRDFSFNRFTGKNTGAGCMVSTAVKNGWTQ